MTHSDIGIVIVTWNSEAEIGPCLDAALATGAEIVVVDNASRDQTVQNVLRREVRLIHNADNRGFAEAVNQGIRALDKEFILLLNPDVVIQTPIDALREACLRPGVAFAAGKLIDCDQQAQAGFAVRRLPSPLALALEALLLNRIWPGNPVNWQYRCRSLDYDRVSVIEQPAGALLMIRRSVWKELGGFDEAFYPLWFEDVDFCKRVAERKYQGYYIPSVIAIHQGGHSIEKISLVNRQLYWYGNFLKYCSKHFGPWTRRGVCLAVITGSILRMIILALHSRSLQPVRIYGNVVALASRYLFAFERG